MSKIFIHKDIYDERGILLLAKGHKAKKVVIEKLKKFGIHMLELQDNLNDEQKKISSSISQIYEKRITVKNDFILQHANNILSSIIFESRTKPWWVYVSALSNYVDWLYTHSIDVAIISLMMAIEIGYNDEELWNLGLGAFLHDVGKLLVPKNIIQKPEKLNKIEKICMQQHCELGMSALKSYALSDKCTNIVLQHHERLDGSGYPKGLKGDEICRNAQIVMIADFADAITAGRPYRKSCKIDESISILKSNKEKYSQELVHVLEKIAN